jgi:hypothetical protein
MAWRSMNNSRSASQENFSVARVFPPNLSLTSRRESHRHRYSRMNSSVGRNCYLMSRQDSITIWVCWVESPSHGLAGGAATTDTPEELTCAASVPLRRVQRARRYLASVAYYLFSSCDSDHVSTKGNSGSFIRTCADSRRTRARCVLQHTTCIFSRVTGQCAFFVFWKKIKDAVREDTQAHIRAAGEYYEVSRAP